MKTSEEQGVGDTFPGSQEFEGVERRVGALDGTRKNDKHVITHIDLHKTKQ